MKKVIALVLMSVALVGCANKPMTIDYAHCDPISRAQKNLDNGKVLAKFNCSGKTMWLQANVK